MKKMLLLLIVVGVLTTGMVSVADAMCETISFENLNISKENPVYSGNDVVPCGGSGGGGSGGVPG